MAFIQEMISFVMAHQVSMAAVGVAVIDLAIELHPSLDGNNLIGLVLGAFKKLIVVPKPPIV